MRALISKALVLYFLILQSTAWGQTSLQSCYPITDVCREFLRYRKQPGRTLSALETLASKCGTDTVERISAYGKDLYYRIPEAHLAEILGGHVYIQLEGQVPKIPEGAETKIADLLRDKSVRSELRLSCDFDSSLANIFDSISSMKAAKCIEAMGKAGQHFKIEVNRACVDSYKALLDKANQDY